MSKGSISSPAEARRRLEQKERPRDDKRMSLAEAAGLVHDGDHVAIGGCLYSRTPMAVLLEILRQKRTDLTLSRSLACYEFELFLVAGACNRIETSWLGVGVPWGISKILRTFVEEGRATYEEWSHLALGLRYRAGAMGVPFIPTSSMLGSDLIKVNPSREMDCPFTGEKVCLVPACFPDVGIIHVHRADCYGNTQIDGYSHMDEDIARAAQTVIVSAEQIVSSDEIARTPDRTMLPHFVVDAVVEAQFGSYPHECYGLYDASFEHFDDYVAKINDGGLEEVHRYLNTYVYGVTNHDEFLRLFPAESLTRARQLAAELTPT